MDASRQAADQRCVMWNGPLFATTRTGGPPLLSVVVIQALRRFASIA
jgi:hypothetical protein